jgi:peptidyl-tRNA hydrolase
LAKGPKLVLRADTEQQLLATMEAARAAGIPHHSIAEACSSISSDGGGMSRSASASGSGEAEVVVPRKTRTILALGPLPAEELPRIAAGLVLL